MPILITRWLLTVSFGPILGLALPAFATDLQPPLKYVKDLESFPLVYPSDTNQYHVLNQLIDNMARSPYEEVADALVDRLNIECHDLNTRFGLLSANQKDASFGITQTKMVLKLLSAIKKINSPSHTLKALDCLPQLESIAHEYPLFKESLRSFSEYASQPNKNHIARLQTSTPPATAAPQKISHAIIQEIETFKSIPVGVNEKSQDYELLMEIASHLSKLEFYESQDVIVDRLAIEAEAILQRFNQLKDHKINNWLDELRPQALLHMLGVLRTNATSNTVHRVRVILIPLEAIYRASEPFEAKVTSEFKSLEASGSRRTTPLGSLHEAIAELAPGTTSLPTSVMNWQDASVISLATRMQSAHDGLIQIMNRSVVGQPEAIQAFAKIEESKVIFPNRAIPYKIMLIGMSGLGKDTLVKTYVDAIHNVPKAWELHLHKAPTIKDQSDLWRFLGASTGYHDSDNVPELFKFLVQHSAGRYRLEIREDGYGRTKWKILENTEASKIAAQNNPMMSSPQKAVIFFNDFQYWTQEMKDELRDAMTNGEWKINNPGGGLDRIYVPVTLVFATSEGSGLISSKTSTGERFGAPLSANKMQEKWQAVHADRQALVDELMKSNYQSATNGSRLGYSRDWLNTFEGSPIVLLRPFGPQELKSIANIKMDDLAGEYFHRSEAQNMMLVASPELIEFLQQHNYRSEEMARPVVGHVEQMVQATINQALRENRIPLDQATQVTLTPVTNPDRTTSLEFVVSERFTETSKDSPPRELKRFQLLIEATLDDKEKSPISHQRIDELSALNEHLQSRVFGLHPELVNGISNSILLAEEAKHERKSVDGPTRGASIFGFFGLSSTGKTEAIKVVNEFLYGDRKPITIDFSQVQNVQDIKEKILGSRDHQNRSVPSDFMQHYDRTNGDLLLAFDEIANAPAWALKALYDIFREPMVTTFSDNSTHPPRPMDRVTILMTGNVGDKWYKNIPKDLPEWVQMYAMQEIYKQVMANPAARRAMLEEHFSEALINRINEQNIYFFGPLTFKSLRELTQAKLMLLVQNLKPKEGRYGWDIHFKDLKAFYDLVEMVEENGFVLAEQGASIENFVNKKLERDLRILLIKQKVKPGSTVVLSRRRDKESVMQEGGKKKHHLVIAIKTEDQELELAVLSRPLDSAEPVRDEDRYLTALHEAGHAIASRVLFKEVILQNKVSIIPGVTEIDNEFVAYEGIAQHENSRKMRITLEWVLRHMAVLAAGETVQRLATRGQIHDAGKQNDMERATQLAISAILKWGLNDRWGSTTIPSDMNVASYINTLSEDRRKILNEEVNKMMSAARDLAKAAMLANMDDAVIPLALELAEKGTLEGKEYLNLMSQLQLQYETQGKFNLSAATRKWIVGQPSRHTVDAELVDFLPLPKKIASYEDYVAKDRAAAHVQVLPPKDLRLDDSCEVILKQHGASSN